MWGMERECTRLKMLMIVDEKRRLPWWDIEAILIQNSCSLVGRLLLLLPQALIP